MKESKREIGWSKRGREARVHSKHSTVRERRNGIKRKKT